MADLVRMLESYSRQTKQHEDKIAAIRQQEELIRLARRAGEGELAGVRAALAKRRRDAEVAASRCGEVVSDLQQKGASIAECQAANESAKRAVASVQQQRDEVRDALLQLREATIASCAQLDGEASGLLSQLRGSLGGSLAMDDLVPGSRPPAPAPAAGGPAAPGCCGARDGGGPEAAAAADEAAVLRPAGEGGGAGCVPMAEAPAAMEA